MLDLGLADLAKPQSINHFITYSVITSNPPLSYTSVLSTIRCFEVTSGPQAGGTFVQWSGQFSGDADAGTTFAFVVSSLVRANRFFEGVMQDAKFKRREALADLEKAAVGKGQGKMT